MIEFHQNRKIIKAELIEHTFTKSLLCLACTELTVQVVARGLVIVIARARRGSSEGSAENR